MAAAASAAGPLPVVRGDACVVAGDAAVAPRCGGGGDRRALVLHVAGWGQRRIAGLLGWLILGERVRPRTWVTMGMALAGVVVMVSGSYGAGRLTGDMLAIMMAAIAVIVGGVGSIPGAALGALLLGVAENVGVWQIPSEWQSSIGFGILLAGLPAYLLWHRRT